ncbi:allergen Asp f 15 precursor [Artomyces pyxidatus]|uniref:Allergen Asp f 15 n=1 Tax=Artomyces pyxidatus TaxID=48021 RepID=A0ACB8T1R7_9AGAM|nr:allergen Asp f 15 precursor [Artomyces pyxidatus]
MKFTSVRFALLSATLPVALADQVLYDQTYDNAAGSMLTVACSNGVNGLANKYPTFGSLPTFPNIGAAGAIAGWNSPNCGTCWELTYNGVSINVTAIDHAGTGFNIALEAMNTLTDGNAVQLGNIQASVTPLPKSACGL